MSVGKEEIGFFEDLQLLQKPMAIGNNVEMFVRVDEDTLKEARIHIESILYLSGKLGNVSITRGRDGNIVRSITEGFIGWEQDGNDVNGTRVIVEYVLYDSNKYFSIRLKNKAIKADLFRNRYTLLNGL